MRKESFKSAELAITKYLYEDGIKAYTTFDITKIFETKRDEWNIADYRNQFHFMKFLQDENMLKDHKLKHLATGKIKQIFAEPDASSLNIALSLKKGGYLSNYTAMQIHQLTLQIPKSIYISFSKSQNIHLNYNQNDLDQKSIDNAFSKPQRVTSEVYKSEIDNIRYYLIQKAFTETNVGLTFENGFLYTDLERTLIDIAIRPAYSGGVFEVLEAFEIAKDKIDIYKLNKYLEILNYIYPYHQLIGFYMDRAGYDEEILDAFKKKSDFNFYLTYNMSNKEYDEKWKIYYPKGF
ncbi:hypothetical protein FLACOL_00164 [Flavobacterium columnare]|uniref:Uncharacterized protein n=2 Tax=Flavobacterium TaxID=237 RepID=A0ABW8PSI5_9FLAO|nr:hypothetical protein [Flavobacterium columnare]SPE76186.1 hypothetical protein FLACOL_00164 [Flavobacterium columnare]